MNRSKHILLFIAILIVTAVGWSLRFRAVNLLPIDYDEDDYLAAGQRYAEAINAGDLQAVIDYDFTQEHPPLTKIIYGLVIRDLDNSHLIPERPPTDPPVSVLPHPHFRFARLSSAVWGTLEVFALAILNPVAGLLLGIHTWQIKYTSQIMIEPLPAFTSLLTVLFYFKARRAGLASPGKDADGQAYQPAGGKHYVWLALSAVALGITAAAKYNYAIIGTTIIVDWLIDARRSAPGASFRTTAQDWTKVLLKIAAWGLFAILIFWAFNPRLWTDPLGRLNQSVFYHTGYAQSEQVADTGFPAWQQLVWLAMSVPWHPGVFLISLDLYILLMALVGLPQLWRKHRVFALWLLIDFVFLLVWPTKWPQYLLTLTVPLCLSAAEGLRVTVWVPTRNWWQNRQRLRKDPKPAEVSVRQIRREKWRGLRKAWLWLVPGAVVLTLIAFYPLIYQSAMSLTDFSSMSLRDGIQGGVWREVWQGLTGQETPVEIDPFERSSSTDVRYVGFGLLKMLFSGALPDILVFNILWTILSIGLQVALGVSVAIILNRDGIRWRGFWRTLFILPWAIPEFIGALFWVRILDPERGWLAVAQTGPADALVSGFLSDPDKTLVLLLVAATWYGFPFIMLAATAGLKMVPEDVYEAAAIDGAGRWMQFQRITWPLLFPLLIPAILIRAIFAFNQFYLFYAMQVDFSSMTFATLSYYLFAPSYFGGRFGISAAINIFTVVILVIFILWFNRVSKAAEGVTYA